MSPDSYFASSKHCPHSLTKHRSVPLRDADLSRGQEEVGVECGNWAEIRRLHRAERMPIKVIARVLGCSKNT
jgi:hypothetical protein